MPRRDVKTFLSFMNEILFPFMFFLLLIIQPITHKHTHTHFNDDKNNKSGFTFI